MSPILPSSLTPHVAILTSPDLATLLNNASLPPLHHILQSYSPLPQVTTRATSLTPIPHTSFALRFSDLAEIEAACKEDPESRASRTIDWIGARITKKAPKWIEDIERKGEGRDARTPWWDELRRCVEGDWVPSRDEGWNHPVAIVLAASTLAPNPLAAITALHSRPIDLPPWVDSNVLRYTLIVHPANSPLSADESIALFNAVKKQYGLNVHLLNLALDPDAAPLPILPLPPRLPSTHSYAGTPQPPAVNLPEVPDTNELKLTDLDTQNAGRFVRELVTMSIVPWMERLVLDWNENFASTRRVTSRLFTSTRRLFGTSATAPSSPNPNSTPLPPSSPVGGAVFGGGPPSQQRRLAEFATYLGDYKLAVTVWEALRKDGKGGAEILPLLLTPSTTHASLAASSLAPLLSPEPAAFSQLRSLLHAVRWDAGVQDLSALQGDQWLVWAAGIAEEPPMALLLAHAAHLSRKRGALRRAAMWYVFAANRLEKCGVKPLTVYFLRKAHELYTFNPPKELSPSFFDAEGQPLEGARTGVSGFDRIVPTLEHSLGRLKYTTGDTEGAVRLFLGLLRGSLDPPGQLSTQSDQVFLDDFRMAFEHLRSTAGDNPLASDLKLPVKFSSAKDTRLRIDPVGDGWDDVTASQWEGLEYTWRTFWKSRGKETVDQAREAQVGDNVWVDLSVKNPMDADVSISSLTVKARLQADDNSDLEVEVVDEVLLSAKETRVIPIRVRPLKSGSLKITHVAYSFLGLLHIEESLAARGKRLNATLQQRQEVVYGPDVILTAKVREKGFRLEATFPMNRGPIVLALGESVRTTLTLKNLGSQHINEIWLVGGDEAAIWLDTDKKSRASSDDHSNRSTTTDAKQAVRSNNSLAKPDPIRIPLDQLHSSSALEPGQSVEVPLILHGQRLGVQQLPLLFVFRNTSGTFFTVRASRQLEVMPILEVVASVRPSTSNESGFILKVEAENVALFNEVSITQITVMSPCWAYSPLAASSLARLQNLPPRQMGKIFAGLNRWSDGSGMKATAEFVAQRLSLVLNRGLPPKDPPPPIDLLFSHVREDNEFTSVDTPYTQHIVHAARRYRQTQMASVQFSGIPLESHPSMFPLFDEYTVDLLVFWEITAEQRSGHILVSGLSLGPGHGALREVIDSVMSSKAKRSMYAETERGRRTLLEAVKKSYWNSEVDPVVVRVDSVATQHDFSTGPCFVPVVFTLRNFSATHPARFVLHLESDSARPTIQPQFLPARFTGLLLRRGQIAPGAEVEVRAAIWCPRAGLYGLGGWLLETEVGEPTGEWRTRAQFVQPGQDELCVSVQGKPIQ